MEQINSTKDRVILFFDVCSRIEGMCASLYHYYSDVFLDDPEISSLWKKTALEEENHQMQFELIQRIRESLELELNTDLERAVKVHGKLVTLLDHVRRNPPDLETALTKAIEMEESLADLHLDSSVSFHDVAIRQMFLALKDFDQDHIKSLRHCLAVLTLPKTEMTG